MERAVRPSRLAGPRAVAEHGTTRPLGRTPLALPRHQNACRSRVDRHSHEGTKTTGLQTATRAGYRQGYRPRPEPLMAMLPRNRNKGKPGEGLTLCMSGGRRPKAEANWQAPLVSRPLDALVGQQRAIHCESTPVSGSTKLSSPDSYLVTLSCTRAPTST